MKTLAAEGKPARPPTRSARALQQQQRV